MNRRRPTLATTTPPARRNRLSRRTSAASFASSSIRLIQCALPAPAAVALLPDLIPREPRAVERFKPSDHPVHEAPVLIAIGRLILMLLKKLRVLVAQRAQQVRGRTVA